MPAVMDVWESEVEVGTVEQQAEVGCEGWNEDGSEEGALFAPSSGDADDNVELAVSPEQGFEVLASPAPEASSDEGIGAGDMLMIPAVAVHDETDLLQASEDDVAIGVAQEDEVAQVETTSVAFPRTTDTVEPTLQPELLPPSDQIAAKVETVTLEAPAKDPISSRALRGSRMLLEIIQGVINQTELEPPKVSSAVRIEEADGETMHSPRFQTSTPEPEALPQLADHDTPFLAHEESHFPRDSTSEPFVQLADDGDISPRSTYVSPSSLRLDDDMMSEPLAEAQDPDDATSYHVTLSSARAQTLEPEPLTHEIKDVITASSGPLESNEAPRPLMPMADFLAQSEDGGVAHNRPLLEMSSSSSLQKLTEPPVFVDEAGEDGVTARTLEHVSKDELPLPLGSIDSSPFQGHRSLRAEDGGQFYVQSTVSTGDISSTPAPQRRTMSNTGSESSLATTDDSPPPPTPPQSAFEAYYIRSTSPDDGLDLDIFSKLTDIPSLPLSQSDEEDDEYLLSLDFSYPDFDVAG
ncbi:hypothetical protein C0992_002588 [Termitomyces sp. T32_za158]|nr:hypothetical protein C0992_002588 [Termitomyces sp. T32_za158]